MASREVIEALVSGEFRKLGRPRTQEDCCTIAARVCIRLEARAWTDEHTLNVAACMAEGIFGPAFDAADYGQRTAWIDMCERAIRAELNR